MPNRENPFSGPAYWVTLKNSLENNGKSTARPKAGGDPISMRIDTHPLNHINAIAELAGWNRSEVLTAIIDCGLFVLYQNMDENIQNELVQNVMEKTPPIPQMGDEC